MRKSQSTILPMRRSLTLCAGGSDEALLRSGDGVGDVSVRISTLAAGATLIAPRESFIALVQVNAKSSAALKVILPDKSLEESLLSAGYLYLLPPGSIATNFAHSHRELIQYQIPQSSLRAFASRQALRNVDSLRAPSFSPDPTMTFLSRAALQLLANAQRCSGAVAEYFTLSLYSHLLHRYGTKSARTERFTGGLSPRHKRIVHDALHDSFDRPLSIEEMAERCKLSLGHFARAFRESFGNSFHKYLLEAKVQRAKQLLLESNAPLGMIALQVGYADQATFTASFTRLAGIPPGRYRRRFAVVANKDYQPEGRPSFDQSISL